MKTKLNIIEWDLEVLADMELVREELFSIGNYPGRTIKASINSVICFGYKRLGEKRAHCISAWDFPRRWKKNINDDYDVVKRAGEILSQADGIITHYGKGFDLKFLNSRLLIHGLPTIPPLLHVDTKYVASKNLLLYSNSLDHLAKILKVPHQKIKTSGKNLWVRVANREVKAQREMARYCKGDVMALDGIFNRLKSLVKDLPNHNMFHTTGGDRCPSCGSSKLQRRGFNVARNQKTQRYHCQDCGTWSHKGKSGLKR